MNFFASIILLEVALSHGTEENSRLLPFLLNSIQHKELNAQAQGKFDTFKHKFLSFLSGKLYQGFSFVTDANFNSQILIS